jgi:hypothetical protein
MMKTSSTFTHRHEHSAVVRAPADRVFAYIDDHTRLSSHMSKSSWKMGGGRMRVELDEGLGKKVGSRIRLAGRVFGIALSVEETVTERDPPRRKVWETTGSPKLLVIGQYRMGFELLPNVEHTNLHVFIEYALPVKAPARWPGLLLAGGYARWCTRQMVDDAVKHFESSASQARPTPLSGTQRRLP